MSKAHHQKTPNSLLRQERIRRGWSQSYVAEKVDSQPLAVSRWESGTTFPSPHYRTKLCELFNKSAAELSLIPLAEKDERIQIHPVYDSAIPRLPSPELVGRKELLTELKHRLLYERGETTLALKGLPGVGKTAIAVTLAHDEEVRTAFSGGILWAGLGDRPNVADLLSRWGKLLGLTTAQMEKLSSVAALTKALRNIIAMRPMLIVIDDVWSIEEALALQIGGPRCAYLVTTRRAEVALHVAGNATTTVHELSVSDGVTLLTHIVPTSKSILNDVYRLVYAVGGLPLALILMGRYVLTQTYNRQQRRLVQAVGRLGSAEERLQLSQPLDLTMGMSNLANGTPLSLQAVIDISDRHLSAGAQSALRMLAVFPPKPNMFQEDAALAVSAASTDVLDELIDAGLVESQGQGYYTLHQVIADYAKTANSVGDAARVAARERMVSFFVHFVVTHKQQYALLERESQNITAALEFACERENFTLFLNGVNSFADLWLVRGQHQCAEQYLDKAQSIAERVGDTRNLALAWLHLARIAELHGEFRHADAVYERGLIAARQSNDVETISILLTRWSALMVHRSEYKRVKPFVEEGMTLARILKNKSFMASLFKSLGEVAYAHGEYQHGSDCYEEGLLLARASEDNEMISALLQNLGAYGVHQHNYQLARQRYEEGLLHARSIKHQERISALLMNQGFLAIQEHNYLLAEKLSYESLELAYEGKGRFRMASVLQNIGIIETLRGHYIFATQCFNESYEIACEIEHAWIANETLCEWGELHLKRGECAFAADKFARVHRAAQTMEMPELVAIALFGLARAAAGRKEYKQSRIYGQESLMLYEKIGHPRRREVEEWLETIAHITATER